MSKKVLVQSLAGVKVLSKPVSNESRESYKLSPEQFKFYEDNGYLVIKELIDFASLYSYKQRFLQICKGLIPTSLAHIRVVKEPELVKQNLKPEHYINKLTDFLYDDVLSTYGEHPALLSVVSQFIGDDITAVNSMFINKPPGSTRHPGHQDLFYFPFRPAEKIIASWTAIDHVTQENGCLYVIPGSHKAKKLYSHGDRQDTLKYYHGLDEDSLAPLDKQVHLEMSPGDTVFFNPYLVHGSGPNRSKSYRKSISFHFANSSCHYIDVKNTVQEHLAKEVEELSKKVGYIVTYVDIWRMKSKQMKGLRIVTAKSTVELRTTDSEHVEKQLVKVLEFVMAFKSFGIHPRSVSDDPSQTYQLSSEEIQFYEDNGYLVIKKLIDLPDLESYRQRFADVCSGKVSRNLLTVVKDLSLFEKNAEPETYINKIQDILYDEVFSTYSEHPRLLHVISQLIGQDLTVLNGMVVNKPPGTNTHYPHQDLLYFPCRPAHQILGTWTAIDPVTEENGCLFMIPGSHKSWELLDHNDRVDDGKPFFFSIANWETLAPEHKRVHLTMDPGDTVLISSTIIHGSMPNLSNSYRKAITCHYANSNCHYIDVTGTTQEKLAKSVEKLMSRNNYDFSFMDLWKMKVKTVRGVKCNL